MNEKKVEDESPKKVKKKKLEDESQKKAKEKQSTKSYLLPIHLR